MSGTITMTSRRAQAGVGVEGGQQLVVKDLHLALAAVGNVKSAARHPFGSMVAARARISASGHELEDVLLQLFQQGLAGLVLNRSMRSPSAPKRPAGGARERIVVLLEQGDVVAPCLPQAANSGWACRCNWSSDNTSGRPALRQLVRPAAAQQVLTGDDIGPEDDTG